MMGGAPFSGKSTLAKRLAAQRGYALVALDDLGTAVRALTTPQSHPALHPMAGWDYRAYYLAHPPATLIEHSQQEHDALWPAMAAVIEAHLRWAGPVILEGWQLEPERVRAGQPSASPGVLAPGGRSRIGGQAAGRYGLLSELHGCRAIDLPLYGAPPLGE
jgi:2-phosphoglycerate kinase